MRETLALEQMALYVRGGAILPLHGGGDVQRAAEQGGALEVQVYSGADGEFVLSEDDGTSLDYQSDSQGGGAGAYVSARDGAGRQGRLLAPGGSGLGRGSQGRGQRHTIAQA